MPNEQGFVVYRVLLPLLLTQGLHTAPPQKWRCMPITGRSNLADQTNYKELAWWTTQQYSTVSSELRTAAFVCEQRRGPRSRQLWVPGAGPQGRKQNCGQIPFSAPRCVLGAAAQVASWCTGAASGRVSEPVLAPGGTRSRPANCLRHKENNHWKCHQQVTQFRRIHRMSQNTAHSCIGVVRCAESLPGSAKTLLLC